MLKLLYKSKKILRRKTPFFPFNPYNLRIGLDKLLTTGEEVKVLQVELAAMRATVPVVVAVVLAT